MSDIRTLKFLIVNDFGPMARTWAREIKTRTKYVECAIATTLDEANTHAISDFNVLIVTAFTTQAFSPEVPDLPIVPFIQRVRQQGYGGCIVGFSTREDYCQRMLAVGCTVAVSKDYADVRTFFTTVTEYINAFFKPTEYLFN